MVGAGLAVNSRRSYSAAVNRYLHFSSVYMLDPLEFNELTALRFIAYLSLNNLSLASIRVYLSGVRAWLVAAGIPHRDIYTTRLK